MIDNIMENCEVLARQIASDMSVDELLDFVVYELSERFHDREDEFQDALASREESYGPFVQFTKRTDVPKLHWLMHQLERADIACMLDGESWHAPITKVHESDLDAAWKILDPVDDLEDDDQMFEEYR